MNQRVSRKSKKRQAASDVDLAAVAAARAAWEKRKAAEAAEAKAAAEKAAEKAAAETKRLEEQKRKIEAKREDAKVSSKRSLKDRFLGRKSEDE